jgi:hypothetical protein
VRPARASIARPRSKIFRGAEVADRRQSQNENDGGCDPDHPVLVRHPSSEHGYALIPSTAASARCGASDDLRGPVAAAAARPVVAGASGTAAVSALLPSPLRSAFSGNRDRRRRWPRWRRWRRPSLRSTWRSRISSCSASGDAPTRPVLEDDRDYRRVSASPAQFRPPSSSMIFSPWPSPGRPQPAPGALQSVARPVVYSASCEEHGAYAAPRMVDVALTIRRCRPATLSCGHVDPPPHLQGHPRKLAARMKRRWRVVLLRAKGEILGTVAAPDAEAAKAAAVGPIRVGRHSAQSHYGAGVGVSRAGALPRGAKSSCRLRRKPLGSMGTRLSPAAVDTAPGLHLSQNEQDKKDRPVTLPLRRKALCVQWGRLGVVATLSACYDKPPRFPPLLPGVIGSVRKA